jgi:hypothetical protein
MLDQPLTITRNLEHSVRTVRVEVLAVVVTLVCGVDGVDSPEGGMLSRRGAGAGPVVVVEDRVNCGVPRSLDPARYLLVTTYNPIFCVRRPSTEVRLEA